ncbi:T9SS type A sorting domain-containing protein, partial [bacterium]|nr:T9SS type A sorting domain-containing protein [bacterium]
GFYDDVESGDGLWTHGGTNDQWHISTEDAHSPTHSWKCGDTGEGTYDNDQESWIKTCPIYVDADHDELSFWTRYELETDYDFVYLDVSVAGGDWVQRGIFSGSKLKWTRMSLNFSSYVDNIVEVRFRFSSSSDRAFEGFYFDDFGVDEASSLVGSVAFTGEAVDEGILLRWRPNDPAEIAGINVLRGEGDAYVRLNEAPLIGIRYLDMDVTPALGYSYKLEVLGADGSTLVFGPIEVTSPANGARGTILDRCYPCPADTHTTVPFSLPAEGHVRIEVYDLAGRLVETLVNGEFTAGRHEIHWRTDRVANGVYLIRLASGNATVTQRIVISR